MSAEHETEPANLNETIESILEDLEIPVIEDTSPFHVTFYLQKPESFSILCSKT